MAVEVRVLVAVSEPTTQKRLSTAARGRGLQVEMADTGHKAIELILQQAFDLAFMDTELPDVRGLDVLEELERQARRPGVSILLADRFSKEFRMAALLAGVFSVIRKPISDPVLERALSQALRRVGRKSSGGTAGDDTRRHWWFR